ncbi:MAG: DivIVA domain-containing protein [Actinomycetota bacterium]|nr:DivIVA domain-containing protein [Actinomycetota bacterium]
MTVVFIAIAVIVGIALVLVGRQGGLPEAVVDLRPEGDPADPRFDVVLRGYRMDEVDAKLEELRAENERLRNDQTRFE